MSTIRIDKKHLKLLDKLIAHLTIREKKVSKKALVAKLIEDAMVAEGLDDEEDQDFEKDEYAWEGLDDVFELDIEDLSERVDELLYYANEED
jgi:hypothetical protein